MLCLISRPSLHRGKWQTSVFFAVNYIIAISEWRTLSGSHSRCCFLGEKVPWSLGWPPWWFFFYVSFQSPVNHVSSRGWTLFFRHKCEEESVQNQTVLPLRLGNFHADGEAEYQRKIPVLKRQRERSLLKKHGGSFSFSGSAEMKSTLKTWEFMLLRVCFCTHTRRLHPSLDRESRFLPGHN